MFLIKTKVKIFILPILILILAYPNLIQAYCGDSVLETSNQEECDDGNYINRDGCNSYCKLEDMTAPTVDYVSIANNAENVDTLTNEINVKFSEAIDPSTINSFNVNFECKAKPFDIDRILSDDGRTLTIKIHKQLFSESRHAIRIKNIKDIAGNIMPEEFISVFTTNVAVDVTKPSVVVYPSAGTYNFNQSLVLKAYVSDYTKSDEYLDENSKIYYTINDVDIENHGKLYKNETITVDHSLTLRYYAIDQANNKSELHTDRFILECAEQKNAKKVINKYPKCEILECNYGFILKNNVCVVRMGSFDDDYKANAVTLPAFSSDTIVNISSKPAIYMPKEHHGNINRPVVFNEKKRGMSISFDKNTHITWNNSKPFYGYIKFPNNLFSKNYPINYGYTFKNIFQFSDADNNDLNFSPNYHISVPYADNYDKDENVYIFTFNKDTEEYIEYDKSLYSVDMKNHIININPNKTETFFIAQKGKSYNKAIFKDTKNHWAKNYIEELYRKKIVKGRKADIFAPDDYLTRAEFTKIILNAIDVKVEDVDNIDESSFVDVNIYAWYLPYVEKAKSLGLIKGYDGRFFRPDNFINRAEAVKMIIDAFGFNLNYVEEKDDEISARRYRDLSKDAWYYPYINFTIQNKIMSGVKKTLNIYSFLPGEKITRAEMSKLTIKTIELKERMDNKK